MKKTFLLLAVAFVTFFSSLTYAQVSVSVNIGLQPAWGPTGYDNVQYYYIPDAGAYYDVNRRVFVYQEGGRWINAASLPGPYGNIDLYSVHKVVINQPSPWLHDRTYRTQYASFRDHHDQMAIRDSHEERYYQNPGHPQHAQWAKQHGNHDGYHDNGNHDHGDHGHDRH